jgi:hydrogenase maturation factor HypF (carbamoyltransferase family)
LVGQAAIELESMIDAVMRSGGVFQNKTLLEQIAKHTCGWRVLRS